MNENLKLPRGSFFYIKLGPQYYGGIQPLCNIAYTIYSSSFKIRNSMYLGYGSTKNARLKAYRKGKTIIENERKNFKPQTIKTVLGYEPILVNDFSKLKKFRRKSQAETICMSLTRLYNGIVTPTIEKFDGSEYSNS